MKKDFSSESFSANIGMQKNRAGSEFSAEPQWGGTAETGSLFVIFKNREL